MIVRLACMRSGYSFSQPIHANFDTETRTLTQDDGEVHVWEGMDLPWEAYGPLTVKYDDGSGGVTAPFGALWAKVNPDGSDPPGFGDTPGDGERFVDSITGTFSRLAGGGFS